jgi:hypothetical protein
MLPNDDGNQQQPTGGQEQPTSAPSGGQQGQQLSDVSALVKQIGDLEKQIRGLQKGTDKRFERQDSDIKRILELKEQGLSEPQIQRELLLDQLISSQVAPPATPVGNVSQGQAPDIESAFRTVEEYGLSQNDPDFIALLRGVSKMDKAAFDVKVKDFVLGKVKPPKPPNPADVVQAPARAGATDKSVDALTDEYKKQVRAARGNRTEIVRLRGEYQKQGVPVHEVDFS